MATAVFDASGNKYALETGSNYMAHGGPYILVGFSKGELTFNHLALHAKESTIMCSRNATLADFEYIIHVIDQFPITSFVKHTVPYTEMIAYFDAWLKPETGAIKEMVTFKT